MKGPTWGKCVTLDSLTLEKENSGSGDHSNYCSRKIMKAKQNGGLSNIFTFFTVSLPFSSLLSAIFRRLPLDGDMVVILRRLSYIYHDLLKGHPECGCGGGTHQSDTSA